MAKKKPAAKNIRRVRVTERGTLIIQPPRRNGNPPGQKFNKREMGLPRLAGVSNRLRYTKDFHEHHPSDPCTDPLNIVGAARMSSINETKDEDVDNQWSFDHSLYNILLKASFLARQRLELVIDKREAGVISNDQITESLKGILDMTRKTARILAILIEQEIAHDA